MVTQGGAFFPEMNRKTNEHIGTKQSSAKAPTYKQLIHDWDTTTNQQKKAWALLNSDSTI